MAQKIFLSADDLLADAFLLARKIYDTGFRPDWIVGVWRGGTPVAIAVHELFHYLGHVTDHMAIQALSYNKENKQDAVIKLRGIEELIFNLIEPVQILLVDDVFDSGRSLQAIIHQIESYNKKLEIITATVWYKPENNKTNTTPDYYLKTTNKWIVFPHELMSLSSKELQQKLGGIYDVVR